MPEASLLDRLPFNMPPFVRQQWASERSREYWQPQITDARNAYQRVEIASVVAGVRRAARKTISPTRLETMASEMATYGLSVTPIAKVTRNRGGYRAKLEHARGNEAYDLSCVIARVEDGKTFLEASREHNDDLVGELLGIPLCCRTFFNQIWHRQKMIDSTWPMAVASSTISDNSIIVSAEPETNVLLRWLGIRLVPHLPCSFHCRESIRLARRLAEVAVNDGQGAGVMSAWEMLSWPLEWSSLHGIAEVRTPIFKIAVDTDATARHHVVQLRGTKYPEGGNRGLRFPFLKANARSDDTKAEHALIQLHEGNFAADPGQFLHSSYLKSITSHKEGDYEFTQNGFSSASAMLFAHLKLLNAIDPIVDGLEGSIVDLGCGTGELLRSLGAGKRDVKLYGVDRDENKIALARTKLGFAAKLYVGNYLDEDGPWLDVRHKLIVGTLAFVESEERLNVCRRLISQGPIAVFYYYSGYRGDIPKLVSRLEMIAKSFSDKAFTQLAAQCWAVHDMEVALPRPLAIALQNNSREV